MICQYCRSLMSDHLATATRQTAKEVMESADASENRCLMSHNMPRFSIDGFVTQPTSGCGVYLFEFCQARVEHLHDIKRQFIRSFVSTSRIDHVGGGICVGSAARRHGCSRQSGIRRDPGPSDGPESTRFPRTECNRQVSAGEA